MTPTILFFFTDPAPTEIYTLSLHDALPISGELERLAQLEDDLHQRVIGQDEAVEKVADTIRRARVGLSEADRPDRKSTRLNSSHVEISYAVFCLKKKKKKVRIIRG